MSSPAEVVADVIAHAEGYAADAKAKLTVFTDRLAAAIQVAPLIDVAFTPIPEPSAATLLDYEAPAQYTSTLLTSLATVLGARLQGGTGLTPSVEAAIWDRARDREGSAAQAAIDTVMRESESLGYDLPVGVLNDSVRRETRAYFDKTSTLSRDIAIKQAELEQSNMQKAIDQVTTYEGTLADLVARRASIPLDEYKVLLQRFQVEVEQDVKRWEVAIKQYEAQVSYIQNSQKLNAELVRANLAMLLEAGKVGAQVYAQLTAASYGLIHASASVSAGASTSVGYSYSNDTETSPPAVTAI